MGKISKKNREPDKFPFLQEPFEYWFGKEMDEFFDVSLSSIRVEPELLKKLNLSYKAFDRIYLEPIKDLDIETRQEIARAQTKYMYYYSNQPVVFEFKTGLEKRLHALKWLLVNVKELNIFEFDDVLVHYQQPFKQCRYCGKPDQDQKKGGSPMVQGSIATA